MSLTCKIQRNKEKLNRLTAYPSLPPPHTQPVFSYVDPTPLPRQALEARRLSKLAESRRDVYLSTNLHKDWKEKKEGEVGGMDKQVGRDGFKAVLGEDGEIVIVRVPFGERDRGREEDDELGPGKYEPYIDEWKKGKEEEGGPGIMEVQTGRGNNVGPFGERQRDAEEEDIRERGREGDRLELDVEGAEDRLRKSVRNVVFGTEGMDDWEGEERMGEGDVMEGDVLELEVDGRVGRRGKEREGKGVVAWDKLTGREDGMGGGAGEEAEGYGMDVGGDKDGDNLILDVEGAVRKMDGSVKGGVIGDAVRWLKEKEIEGDGDGDGDRDGDYNTNLSPVREKRIWSTNWSKMIGRNDAEEDDMILQKMENKADIEHEYQTYKHIDEHINNNIDAAIKEGKISGKYRINGVSLWGKSTVERWKEESGGEGEGGVEGGGVSNDEQNTNQGQVKWDIGKKRVLGMVNMDLKPVDQTPPPPPPVTLQQSMI